MRIPKDKTRLLALALRNESALAMEHARMLDREYGNRELAEVWRANSDWLRRLSDELTKPYYIDGARIEPSH